MMKSFIFLSTTLFQLRDNYINFQIVYLMPGMGWLNTKYNGLIYSKSQDGGYCLFCMLFGQCEPSVKELGILVNRPLTNFKNAIEKLNEHFFFKR